MSELGNDAFNWLYAFALLVLGFVLVLMEIFVIPGFNIFGILGFGSLCLGILYAYSTMGIVPAIAVAVAGTVGTIILVRLLIRRRAWQNLVLHSQISRSAGYDASPPGMTQLTGKTGQTHTPLRPSGRALIEDQLVDVVTEGAFIDRDRLVVVLEVSGNRVVVQERLDTV